MTADISEACIVFGDAIVERALQNPRDVEAEVRRDVSGVRFDVLTLNEFLPEHLGDAIAWAQRLSDARQVAIAGLWCGNPAASYLMAENGLFLKGVAIPSSQSAKGQRVWAVKLELPGGAVKLVRVWAHGEVSATNKASHRYRGARVQSVCEAVDDG